MKTSIISFLSFIRNSLVIVSLFFCSFDVSAHDDLLKRILSVTEEIKAHPDSAFLYFKRGQLYFQHDDFNNSLEDLKRSRKLGLSSIDQYFLLANNHSNLNNFNSSKRYIHKILKDQPNNVNALKLLGHVYFKKGKFKKSATAFEKVIAYSKETFPENYIDASKAWYALKNDNGIFVAKTILLEGIEKLGNNIVLYQELISNAVHQKEYALAIEHQKRVVDFSPRKERAYLKLAELQILKKDYSEAEISIRNAKNHFEKLPVRIKSSNIMSDFYSELESKDELLKNML